MKIFLMRINPFIRYPRLAVIYFLIFVRLFWDFVRGKVPLEFILALIEKKKLRQGRLLISLLVTSACGMHCEHCIMRHLLRAQKDYQMSLEEVQAFIEASERSGYKFDIMLTGGEPSLWKHLKNGVLMLKRSRICGSLMVFTNATSIESLLDEEVIGAIDKLWISNYKTTDPENVKILQERYASKIDLHNMFEFWETPQGPVADTLPAECLNGEIFLCNYQVYACPHSASIAHGNGSTILLSNPLRPGFIKGLSRIKNNQQKEICAWCISNNKLRRKIKRVSNLSEKERENLA